MTEPLNVVLVVLDCARAEQLSGAGYGRETTPFLDQLGREGVRFTSMIATAPWALPAHASLFTGLYPVTHGATDERRALSARHATLPQYFKTAGYRTAAFCTNPWVSPETGFGRGFDAFYTQRYHNRLAARAVLYGRRASDRLLRRKDAGARRTNQALRRWIASGTQPFFAFVHYHELHLSITPPSPYDRMFASSPSTDAATRRIARYDGALRYVDARVREIADFLQARGEWERTAFIVTGSHGVDLGEPATAARRLSLSDAWLRVPLIVRCPSQVPQGFSVDDIAQTTDVLPTILRLAGIAVDGSRVQGRALFDAGRATPGPAFAVAERFRPNLAALRTRFPDADTRAFDVRRKAIRSRREKFVWHSDEANEFYDLIADPGESDNRIERDVGRADRLRRQLFDWLATVEQAETVEAMPELDEQVQGAGDSD